MRKLLKKVLLSGVVNVNKMAEAEVKMAGKGDKQRKDSLRKSKTGNSDGKSTDEAINVEHVSTDNEVTCQICSKVFVSDSDKLMECERCNDWYCTKCLDMNDKVYKIMNDRKDIHWYCKYCELQAVTAVKTDKDIEDRCATYMKSITDRLDKMDAKIEEKADKDKIKDLEQRMTRLEENEKGAEGGDRAEVEKQTSDTVRVAIEEQREREFRARNIVIINLPESDKSKPEERQDDDIKTTKNLLTALDITEDDAIEKCWRMGKMQSGKNRVTKVTLKSSQLKRNVLRKTRSLKDIEEYDDVFVGPDLTDMQRKEQYVLRKELKARKDKGERNIFISRGKIVQAKERAVQFKGGASSTTDKH